MVLRDHQAIMLNQNELLVLRVFRGFAFHTLRAQRQHQLYIILMMLFPSFY
jgi:hypothetical protein